MDYSPLPSGMHSKNSEHASFTSSHPHTLIPSAIQTFHAFAGKVRRIRSIVPFTLGAIALVLIFVIVANAMPSALRGALFQIGPGGAPPITGVYINRGYQAQPNERGSVLLQAAQSFTDFEGIDLTFVVDSQRAEILRVRRTAVTENFDVSYDYPAPGVVHVALVGRPRAISVGSALLEFELQLAANTVNTTGNRSELRLLNVSYRAQQSGTASHDGLITFISNQNALTLPFTPFIRDIDPGVIHLVRNEPLVIRGRAFPSSPRVLLGNRPIRVISASTTEVLAMIPEDTLPGTYPVSLESLLADEKVVVIDAPGITGSVDILDELMFVNPNPVLYTGEDEADIVLWVPVFNPLSADDPVIGSVDFSSLGGDPNVVFSGVGAPAIGPGGVMVNWFRVPDTGVFSIPASLASNADYPLRVRVENRTLSEDHATEMVQLRSHISLGSAPSFGRIESVPSSPIPGDSVSFYVDVTHPEGVGAIASVSLRLTAIGGGVKQLAPVLTGVPLKTVAYSTNFTIPKSVAPGTYLLELVALDTDGDETKTMFSLIVSPPGGQNIGRPPQFTGRREARPATTGPGAKVDFFATVVDPDGTATIQSVTIDLIDIGGSTKAMEATEDPKNAGILPVTYTTNFQLPPNTVNGTYNLQLRAIDTNGLSATSTVTLTVDSSLGGGGAGGSAPQFGGRLEATPAVIALEGLVNFYVGVSDPDGTDTIKQVTIDLIDVAGGILELTPTVKPVKGSIQPIVYQKSFKLPNSVAPGVYNLAVRATDQDGNTAATTLLITVSAIAQQRGVPVIRQVFASPERVIANDDMTVSFTAEVEDPDGVKDITVALVNLAPLQLGIQALTLDSATTTAQGKRGFFVSKKFKIPTSVKSGGYDLKVEVEDSSGNRATKNIRLTVGEGSIGGDVPVFLETRFVPETARPGGEFRLFAEMEDRNSADGDDLTVIADFTELRLETQELKEIIKFPSGTIITRNTFGTKVAKLPKDIVQGVYDIPLTAVDKTNNIVRTTVRLRIEKGGAADGQGPKIDTNRSFQVPRVFANDGKDKNEFSILVADPDDDVLTVIVNLGSIGRASSASIKDGVGDIALLCNESRSLVCMKKSVPEGTAARWFVLEDIAIPPTTAPSTTPYFIDVTAIDKQGHTEQARIPILIGDAKSAASLGVAPAFMLIVPVSSTELELVVDPPVKVTSVERGGGQFIMRSALDAFSTAKVNRVSWDTSARILYLKTDPLTAGETYIFSSAEDQKIAPLTDIYGNRFGGKVNFTAFAGAGQASAIHSVTVVDPEHIDVHFTTQILPSSVHPDVLPSRAHLTSTVTLDEKRVKNGQLLHSGKTLRLTVDKLREGDRYRLRITDVLAPGLIAAPASGVEKIFIALFPREGVDDGPLILPTADLNKDGRVDFADFALFSSVYNTEYDLSAILSLRPQGHGAAGEEDSAKKTPTMGKAKNNNPLGGDLPDLTF
jgi:hypothetical protein